MSLNFDMTAAERESFLRDARKELVEKLYNELASDIQTISKASLAGLLDVDGKTLEKMGVPRVPCTMKLIRYHLSSVAKWIADREEK